MRYSGFSLLVLLVCASPTASRQSFDFPSPRTVHAASPDARIDSIIALVNDSMVSSYIEGLQNLGTRMWSRSNRALVAAHVSNEFSAAGLTEVAYDTFTYLGYSQSNIVATIPGASLPDAVLVVGGHFDSISPDVSSAPGADDNASGTAAVLEMARVLQAIGYRPTVTLKFIGFAAEEAGLRGSYHYAGRAAAAGMNIKVMLNFDMIGHRDQTQPDREFNIVRYDGSGPFANLFELITKTYTTLEPRFTYNHQASSDSWPFYTNGYNAVFVIERDFSPYYHSVNDRLEYLDIPFAADIIRSGLATLLTLDAPPPAVEPFALLDCGDGQSLHLQCSGIKGTVPDFSALKISLKKASASVDTTFLTADEEMKFSGLLEGERYSVGVSVIDLLGLESPPVEGIATPRTVPLPPSSVRAEAYDGRIHLSWQANREMDLHSYVIFRKEAGEDSYTILGSPGSRETTYVDSSLHSGFFSYFLRAVDSTGYESTPSDTVTLPIAVAVGSLPGQVLEYRLHQNAPNPFNPSTHLRFQLASSGWITLTVYSLLGQEVAVPARGFYGAGEHTVQWDAQNMPAGIYFCRLDAETGYSQTIKIALIK